MDESRSRKCCQCSVKRWLIIVLLIFVLGLGLAILISSVTFLHIPGVNQSNQCVGSLKPISINQTVGNSSNMSNVTHADSPAVGDPCSDNSSCPENSVCVSGQCSCNVTYQEYNGSCLIIKAPAVGDPCSDNSSCPENSVCVSGQCSCNVTYQEYNGSCLKVPAVGDPCSDNSSCPENSVCVSGQCSCNVTYQEYNGSCLIIKAPAVGDPCSDNSSCPENSVCVSGQCSCNVTYQEYNGSCLKVPAVGDPCSDNSSCPENSVCVSGRCSCNVTSYQEYNGSCLKVSNLALGKPVFASSNFYSWYDGEGWENAVDGLTNITEWKKLFHTGYEVYPWLSIVLGRLALVRSVTVYNRVDNYGRWLHNVEARVGNSSDWTKLSSCGTFVGPSDTGQVHVIECGNPLPGTVVTVKMVKPNYITDEPAAANGVNCLVLDEVTVEGVFL
uniref:Prion-like-(Q/N-rich) domain-bearing protein 25 isoform X2 n=1 Tax=Crassostrea virginica TaxID=6565 RepID=A0A8B8B053_CRAVI|nr:prion-like-(Q/N-rich) domain-bearing protein 25 isoform X2 [Crassostrea virginica]